MDTIANTVLDRMRRTYPTMTDEEAERFLRHYTSLGSELLLSAGSLPAT